MWLASTRKDWSLYLIQGRYCNRYWRIFFLLHFFYPNCCASTPAAIALGKEALYLAGLPTTGQRPSTFVSAEVLNQIVIAGNHSRHRIDNARADVIVKKLALQLRTLGVDNIR